MPFLINKRMEEFKHKKYGNFISTGSCIGLFILVVAGIVMYYRYKEKKIKDSVINYVKKEELYTVEDYLKKREIERDEEIKMIEEYLEQESLTPHDKTIRYIKNNKPNEIEHFIDETIAERMAHENRPIRMD